jgi:SanA protein
VLGKVVKMIGKVFLILAGLSLLAILLPRLITGLYSYSRLYTPAEVPGRRVAIVFGAGLRWDGTPTPILRDRVETAADLFFASKVEKLLMSGDNRFSNYNEPGAMQVYAMQLGVPEQAIVMDYAGRRTYDSCFRARAIFGLDSVILVTQKFHLPRALFICNALGVEAVGVSADRRIYWPTSILFWNLREQLATVTALWDVYVAHPQPVLGEPHPIFSERK